MCTSGRQKAALEMGAAFLQVGISQYVSARADIKIEYAVIVADTAHKIIDIGYRLDIAAVDRAAKLGGEYAQCAYSSAELAHDRIFEPEAGLIHISAAAFKHPVDRYKQLHSKYRCALGLNLFVDGENYVAFLFKLQCFKHSADMSEQPRKIFFLYPCSV